MVQYQLKNFDNDIHCNNIGIPQNLPPLPPTPYFFFSNKQFSDDYQSMPMFGSNNSIKSTQHSFRLSNETLDSINTNSYQSSYYLNNKINLDASCNASKIEGKNNSKSNQLLSISDTALNKIDKNYRKLNIQLANSNFNL